jgi:hypothetical protein
MKVLAALALWAMVPQETYFPLREGSRLTYTVEDRGADAAETSQDVVAEVRGARSIGDLQWTEMTDFLGYSSCFLRVAATGIDLKVDPSEAAPVLTLLRLPLRQGDQWKGSLGRDEVTFTTGSLERVELADRVAQATRVGFTVADAKKHQGHPPTHGDLWFEPGVGLIQAQLTQDLDCHSGTSKVYRLKK